MTDNHGGMATPMERLAALPDQMCRMVCNAGPSLEPLACAYKKGHVGPHSWATLPTFVAGYGAGGQEAERAAGDVAARQFMAGARCARANVLEIAREGNTPAYLEAAGFKVVRA